MPFCKRNISKFYKFHIIVDKINENFRKLTKNLFGKNLKSRKNLKLKQRKEKSKMKVESPKVPKSSQTSPSQEQELDCLFRRIYQRKSNQMSPSQKRTSTTKINLRLAAATISFATFWQ